MEPYKDTGAVTADIDFPTTSIKGKTAVITGGANGMGAAYVRALTAAGAYVVYGDLDTESGEALASSIPNGQAKFLLCDVTVWSQQLALFKAALSHSSSKRIDIVIANAGISGFDDVFHNKLELEDPEEPKLTILKVNGIGVLYTTKLALHYFRRQFQQDPESSRDQLLIEQGSLAGFLDLRGSMQYGFCKWGMRGVMRNLRRTEHEWGIRVNYIAPGFVKTGILSPTTITALEAAGFEFATVESAARAVMKLSSDKSINGRSFAIVPEAWSSSGYQDIDGDEYTTEPLKGWQNWSLGAAHRQLSKEAQATKAHEG